MKKFVALLLAALMLVTVFAACAKEDEPVDVAPVVTNTDASETDTAPAEGKVLNIYAWNEEFKGFFEKYYTVPDGITVNWVINPSEGGVYQQKLDEALLAQADAAADDKIDMFLAEADYIQKYVDSDYTMSIDEIGYANADTMYEYTIKACTDTRNGECKGVSFQCCPAAVIYRRSIAKDVLGTDDPAEVQAKISTWADFEAVAAEAKAKGYYMTASFAETYRTFSNNCTVAWVDDSLNLQLDAGIEAWIAQTKTFMDNGYTLPYGIWDGDKNNEMASTGKTMCFFGPAWYFNFCMGPAHEGDNNTIGDWAIVTGPQAYFWGGTWLLAATGSDNPTMLKDIFEAFTIDEDVCTKLIVNEAQFTNNKKVNEAVANDANYASEFLGGQNDVAIFVEMADGIKWENHTMYDQMLNEDIQTYMKDYFTGAADYDTAYANFLNSVKTRYPEINVG